MRFGFVGPAYAPASPHGGAEALINWRPQKMESPNSRTAYLLLRTSGLSLFANLGVFNSVRGFYAVSGRLFAVAGTHLFELTAAGNVTDYGGFGTANNQMIDDGLPATMTSAGTIGGLYPSQLLIASGGNLTVFSLASNSYQPMTTPPPQVLMVDFLDGFFIALSAGNTWSVSNPEDATTWPGISIAQVSVFSDQLTGLIASNELLWVFGARRAVGYYTSGAPLFPFDKASGAFMEVGLAAQYTPTRVATHSGTTIMWLGGDERGQGIVYAANGYIPQRVSDSALEYWMSQQLTIADAVGAPRQEEGQNFYDLWFPTANAMWTLDVDLGWWHRRSSLVGGIPSAHLQSLPCECLRLPARRRSHLGQCVSPQLKLFHRQWDPDHSHAHRPSRPSRMKAASSRFRSMNSRSIFSGQAWDRSHHCSTLREIRGIPMRCFLLTQKTSAKPGGLERMIPCGGAGERRKWSRSTADSAAGAIGRRRSQSAIRIAWSIADAHM